MAWLDHIRWRHIAYGTVALVLLALLTGCAALPGVTSRAAELQDEAASAAELAICRGISIGAWMRRYSEPAKAQAWRTLCAPGQGLPSEGEP